MNNKIKYSEAKNIMGNNIIGPEELRCMKEFELAIPTSIPDIPYSAQELENKKNDYYLILGINKLKSGGSTNIKNMISIFGKDPFVSEPCFYNQDWYEKEDFIKKALETEWFLIRKSLYEDSRAIQPEKLITKYTFPFAVNCTYAFFVLWKTRGVKLWCYDFVWCRDVDHNGDRIYVGKYIDTEGMNKNGFSIHRHLGLRSCYGCID